MGSFTSAPKILNEDAQDSDVALPARMTRSEILERCRCESAHPLLRRSFKGIVKDVGVNIADDFKMLQINAISKGDYSQYENAKFSMYKRSMAKEIQKIQNPGLRKLTLHKWCDLQKITLSVVLLVAPSGGEIGISTIDIAADNSPYFYACRGLNYCMI